MTTCPGCGVELPETGSINATHFNASGECTDLFVDAQGLNHGDPSRLSYLQLTVDAYASQHAGGPHPDTSVDVHLAGLYLWFERGLRPPDVARLQQRLAATKVWPHFAPPARAGEMTIGDVVASRADAHTTTTWGAGVWRAWDGEHEGVARFVGAALP
jgi:hypothetical protein